MESSRKCFLKVNTQKLCSRGSQDYTSHQQPNLVISKNHPGGTGFEGMKESQRTTEAWHCEKPGKVTGQSAASEAAKGPN